MIKIFASGRITQEPKTFNYGEGKMGVSFNIASNDYLSEEPEYLSCVMFNSTQNFASSLAIGNQVIVTGRYQKNEKGYVSCIVDSLEFGASKKQ